ncbi:hypothetical protein ACIQVT_04980 [Streptomyces sp. NPDC100445]|uniref:hypothetical protein n=1 Tax=Streptomyces sp. NPDC100445 TaxID=3366102 RepID=UPI0037F60F3B
MADEFDVLGAFLNGPRPPKRPSDHHREEVQEDLILRPKNGVAGIVQDELGNTYDLSIPFPLRTEASGRGRTCPTVSSSTGLRL